MTQLTPEQALGVLDAIADPRNAGKLDRMDYVRAQAALETLVAALKELAALKTETKADPADKP